MSPSGDRTEKATPKRRREAREKGQVLKSHDLSASIQLLGLLLAIQLLAGDFAENLRRVMGDSLASIETDQVLTVSGVMGRYPDLLLAAGRAVLPLFGFALVLAAGPNLIQTRFLWTTKTLSFKFSHINPAKGLKRLFSIRTLVELLKSILKITVVIAAVYQEFSANVEDFTALLAYPAVVAVAVIFNLIIRLALRCAAVILVFGVLDYVYQWWNYEKELRMTKQEIKDEYKLTEGNPQIKGRIRQIQRLIASRRMMQAIPEATVVITNPTHFAVALRYQAGKDTAPVVLAKGQDQVALRIKDIAREHQVALVENRPLARSLFASCEIGGQIPAELFGAVAEVLAYLMKLKGGGRA